MEVPALSVYSPSVCSSAIPEEIEGEAVCGSASSTLVGLGWGGKGFEMMEEGIQKPVYGVTLFLHRRPTTKTGLFLFVIE